MKADLGSLLVLQPKLRSAWNLARGPSSLLTRCLLERADREPRCRHRARRSGASAPGPPINVSPPPPPSRTSSPRPPRIRSSPGPPCSSSSPVDPPMRMCHRYRPKPAESCCRSLPHGGDRKPPGRVAAVRRRCRRSGSRHRRGARVPRLRCRCSTAARISSAFHTVQSSLSGNPGTPALRPAITTFTARRSVPYC